MTDSIQNSLNRSAPLSQIPGDSGLPIFGDTFQFLSNPISHGLKLYNKHGPIFRTNFFFNDAINILGPDAVQSILQDRDKNYSNKHGYEWIIGDLFKGGILLRDFEDHLYHRRIMQSAFKKAALEDYLNRMNPHIALHTYRWSQEENFLFYPATKEFTLKMATTCFLGYEIGAKLDQVNKCLMDMLTGSIALIRTPIPGLAYHRGLKQRSKLAEIIRELIPEKRQSPTPDMLTHFCLAESEEGESYTDEEIINHTILMWVAAHDTTSSALSTAMSVLASKPDWQNKIREECQSLHKQAVDFEDLEKLEQMEWFIKECLRLYPPLVGLLRRTTNDTEFYNFKIPANTLIAVGSGLSHFMEEYWTNPFEFDPERFSPQRAEDKNHKFAWLPFGGGAHRCIGMHFANMQLKAILHQLLLNYQWTLPPNYTPKFKMLPIPRPKDGLPVFMTPITSKTTSLH